MSKSIKGSETEKNVALAFANESMTVNRYSIFAGIAFSEGLDRAGRVFAAISEEEKGHAGTLLGFFEGGVIELDLKMHAVPAGGTKVNIENAVAGENAAWSVRYPDFAGTARREGYAAVAEAFEKFTLDEKGHEAKLKALLKGL